MLSKNDTFFPTRRLIIIDPQPLFRKGVKDVIGLFERLKLVGEAANDELGIELVREKQPDLVLLSLNMKGSDPIETIKTIKLINDQTLIIVLSDSAEDDNLYTILQAGADGFLPREIEPEELMAHLADAVPGSTITSRALRLSLQRILMGDTMHPESAKEIQLTRREEEVLQLLTTGLCNKRIGRELGISDGTVKVHIKHLLKKLQVRSRLEAVCWFKQQSNK